MEETTGLFEKDSLQLSPEESQKIEQKKEKLDRNFALAVASFILLISAFLMVVDLKTLEVTSEMRILGPGAFPLGIFGILIILNIWYMIEVYSGRGGSAKLGSHIEIAKMKKALRLFFLIVITIFIMNFIGYILALMVFTFIEMKFLSEKKVKSYVMILCIIILPLSIYFIFHSLNISLPSPSWMPF